MISVELFAFVVMLPMFLLLLHPLLNRIPSLKKIRITKRTVFIEFISVGLLAIVFTALYKKSHFGSGDVVLFFISMALLSIHLYFHVFNMSETARRIHILQKIRNGEGIKDNYSSEHVAQRRFERLTAGQLIQKRGDRYYAPMSVLVFACYVLKVVEQLLFPSRFSDHSNE